MQNSILFRPCPPACSPDIPFPDIYVQDDFWSLSTGKKLVILQGIYYNRPDLQADLLGPIATLQEGTNLVLAN